MSDKMSFSRTTLECKSLSAEQGKVMNGLQ